MKVKFCTGAFKSTQPNMLWSPFNVQDVFAEGRNGSTPKTLEGGRFPSRTWDCGDMVFVTDVTL